MSGVKRWIWSWLLLPLLWVGVPTALAAPSGTENVQVELISEVDSIQPGSSFWVAIRLQHQGDWHTYWKNPGDAGYPTSISWDLPDGLEAGTLHWPIPKLFEVEGIASLGYGGAVSLLAELTADASLPVGSRVTLAGSVSWLECEAVCIPGDGDVSLELPVRAEAPASTHADLFAAARKAMPLEAADWSVTAHLVGDTMQIRVTPPEITEWSPEGVRFHPEQEGLIDYASEQTMVRDGGDVILTVPLNRSDPRIPEQLSGVLVTKSDSGLQGVAIATPFPSPGAPLSAVAQDAAAPPPTLAGGLLAALGLAFLGGIILNLMPCVFPVISLKILGFVKLADSNPKKIWHHGLVFAGGVLVCFWLLAGTLIALKSAGEAIGWGFQLQSPGFVVGMAVLFMLIALNLFGVFEIGTGLTGVGADATKEEGYLSSFLSGMLATVIATPCTAPFMAGALGFALTQPAWAGMMIFTFLGLGMATPYLLLSRFPQWLNLIPRPGPWMESLKQGMGFLILAFAAYLIWVYAGQRGDAGLFRLLAGLLTVSVGGWVLGRWGALSRTTRSRWIARTVCMGCVVAGTALGMSMPPSFGWQPYSPEAVQGLVDEGNPVFVDFTAQWCITCQANKKVALNRKEVQERFKELGVTIMTADWTDKNETIARVLEGFGRSGVPLYVLYPAEEGRDPILLPELLTPAIVLNALDEL